MNRLLRMGYHQRADGYFIKRVEFDVAPTRNRKPYVLVKYLTRDTNGNLVRGERGRWMTKGKSK